MRIITDAEAIRQILQKKSRYICYLGAGASAEADVMTAQQICKDIRGSLLPKGLSKTETRDWEITYLNWDDPSRRYATCMHRYGNPAKRVQYFRDMLKGKTPSFCHYALSLLIANSYFKSTCLTTNFDKLLESAFTRQALMECQPIRTEDELKYWEGDNERCYIIKLHGDYDTNNILNTDEEVILIKERMRDKVADLSKDAGMLVLGTAGYEKSIHTLFDHLTAQTEANEKVLSYGLLWGVYVPGERPDKISQEALERLVQQQLADGRVGQDILAMMSRMSTKNEDFCLFPMWGAGNFMFDLVKATNDKLLNAKAELYLDHEMRLRHVFTGAGLKQSAITRHIDSLKEQQRKLTPRSGVPSPRIETVLIARKRRSQVMVRVAYGDVTKRSWMADPEFQQLRRAIVSPDDTSISAGGGVAYLILEKAGKYNILNELAKFSPIGHDTVAITSGGDLPVHYIFHAAAVEIQKNGNYAVTKDDVYQTMIEVLDKAKALNIGALWVPLMGAGVASLGPKQSLEGISKAIADWKDAGHQITIMIVIYREGDLPRSDISGYLKRSAKFDVLPVAAVNRSSNGGGGEVPESRRPGKASRSRR